MCVYICVYVYVYACVCVCVCLCGYIGGQLGGLSSWVIQYPAAEMGRVFAELQPKPPRLHQGSCKT